MLAAPADYDANANGTMERGEVVLAITDHFAGNIDRDEVLRVIGLYISGARVEAAPNLELSALSLSYGNPAVHAGLSPGLTPATDAYTADVSSDVSSVTVSAEPSDPDATVVIGIGGVQAADGTVGLREGANVIEVEVTAGDGASSRTYTVTVVRAMQIDWTPCEPPGVECGFVEVPADYRDPGAGSIMIAVNVHRAASRHERVGYLLVNPGGPGGSGLELVQHVSRGAFAEELVERFDIVGFDPRGVGASEPAFACGGPGEQLALLEMIDGPADTPGEIAAGEAAARLCIESMGPIGSLLHSRYVANDMNEIRRALGVDQVSYLGFSYGSTLGVWYATLFPGSVRAMVLDGADDPVDLAATQRDRVDEVIELNTRIAALLERALTACSDPQCPMYNDGDPIGYYEQAVRKLDLVNSAAGGHPLAGLFGVISTLYNEEWWPYLWQGLFELNENDDPSVLSDFATVQFGPEPTGASFTAHVNCLDDWVLHPALDRAARLDDSAVIGTALAGMFPLLDLLGASLASPCPFYDLLAPRPFEGTLDGGGVPILVIGNHSDPFTPFSESEDLAIDVLDNGYLVETSHTRHTVYPESECVNDHVHRALIDGVYPTERRVFCEQARR